MASTADLLALARAGFSREEIAAILGAAPAQEQSTPPQQDPEPAPEPKKEPEPEKKKPEPAASQPDLLAQLLSKFDGLQSAIQANAVMSTKQPEPETADQILAAIIRPPRKE